MTFPIYEPVSQCNICGLDFPESELMRHYRTGRLVDRLCNDERTASDNLAILKRPNESRRRAKQPVPSSEESSGQETVVLSLYPPLILNTNYTIAVDVGAGVGGSAYAAGSINVGVVGVVAGTDPVVGLVWDLSFLVNAPRVIKSLSIAGISPNTKVLPTLSNFLSLTPPRITLTTTIIPLNSNEYYEWQYVLIY